MIDLLRKEVSRALNGIRMSFRGTLQSLKRAQRVQLATIGGLDAETQPDVELFQQFGFTSAPPAGTQVIVLPLGGRTSHSVIVATENGSFRMQLQQDGEVAVYNQWGDYVWLKADRSIELKSALKVRVLAPQLECTGEIKDRCDTDGITMEAMRNAFNAHAHPGVAAGSSTTATPNNAPI